LIREKEKTLYKEEAKKRISSIFKFEFSIYYVRELGGTFRRRHRSFYGLDCDQFH